jgi:putative transposase
LPAPEASDAKPLPTIWSLPDELWERIEPILDRHYPPAKTGRPRADLRLVIDGIIYRLRSAVQWNQLPRRFGADSTVHGWFQRFVEDGVLQEIWAVIASECEALGDLDWSWQAVDAMMGKARLGGAKRGPSPTDRAKPGTKKSLHVERSGGPLGVEIEGANVHDSKLLEPTLAATVLGRPDPKEVIQHLSLDKAYDSSRCEAACEAAGLVPHIRRIGEEKLDEAGLKRHPARRWVVERTLAWLSKCRAILVRYDKKPENYEGLIQLACALLWCRRLQRLRWGTRVSG